MITDALIGLFRKDPTVKRHLAKTISWRIVGSLDTMLLGWLITGHIEVGAKIGGVELLTKMVLYYLHERSWHHLKFGLPGRHRQAEKVKTENAAKLFRQNTRIHREEREQLNDNHAFTIWLTGLSASGKSSVANELDAWFYSNGLRSYIIDGDNTRLSINSDLSFSKEDRSENIRRVAEICKLFNDAGIIAIASFISPFAKDREQARDIIGAADFAEVFVDASLETCKARDAKGLYKLAEAGKIKEFTGISSPYERPATPDVHLHSDNEPPEELAKKVVAFLTQKKLLELPATAPPGPTRASMLAL
jgi:adenylyl-sulfate kinase